MYYVSLDAEVLRADPGLLPTWWCPTTFEKLFASGLIEKAPKQTRGGKNALHPTDGRKKTKTHTTTMF